MTLKSDFHLEKCAQFIKGTCMTMCPEKERQLRERENLLHFLEKSDQNVPRFAKGRTKRSGLPQSKADRDKIVKCFSRSAAGLKAPEPSDLRPAPVLNMTVGYLLNKVAAEDINDKTWVDRYQFVTDRLRAVRQDMVIQNLPVADCISILEPIVRFHCYAAYRLCGEPIDVYDPKLNSVHLQECIKRLLLMYDSLIESDLEERSRLCKNQSEFEALYLSLNLGDVSAIRRGLEQNSKNKVECYALELSLSWLCGNYVRVGRVINSLPVLLLCATATQLPALRRRALAVMTMAYSSKMLRVPLGYLRTILKWSGTNEQIMQECTHYGLQITTDNGETYVSFLKGTFKTDAQQVGPKREKWIEDKLRKTDFRTLMFPSLPDSTDK